MLIVALKAVLNHIEPTRVQMNAPLHSLAVQAKQPQRAIRDLAVNRYASSDWFIVSLASATETIKQLYMRLTTSQ